MTEFNENEIESIEQKDPLKQETDPNCTCNDKWRIAPCPVHFASGVNKQKKFGQAPIIVTDANLISDQYVLWQGYIFQCPVCGKPSIMVNPTMGKFCCNCGIRVEIHSEFITNIVKNIENKYNR